MAGQVSLRSIGPSVYLPSLLFGIGQGAIAPAIALSARELGASVAAAGLIVAVGGVGRVVADLPAGMLAVRIGERRAMLLATALSMAELVLCIAATAVWMLAVGILCKGLATSVWVWLGRHTSPRSCRTGCGPGRSRRWAV
jgi:MFS family permease